MAKQNTLFKNAFNRYLSKLEAGMELPSETGIAAQLGVGRSTVRAILDRFEALGVIAWNKRRKIVLRSPAEEDFYPEAETSSLHDLIEKSFMRLILSGEAKPGLQINELEMAREIGVATSSVREYLIRFSRFGLIEKRPNSHWVLKGFTREFALELANVREMFERHSALEFGALPQNHILWLELRDIEAEHRALRETIDENYRDFSQLDERFHLLIHRASHNRFILDFYDVIAMVFHYHYQWNRASLRSRNLRAINEHLAYIEALYSHDAEKIEAACRAHLRSARETLLESVARNG